VHAAGNEIGDDGARALAVSLEKNTTLKTIDLRGARLCARGGWERGDVTQSYGRRPLAGAHFAERARACSWAASVRRRVPLPGAWLLLLSA
jgi:hypothetical protein